MTNEWKKRLHSANKSFFNGDYSIAMQKYVKLALDSTKENQEENETVMQRTIILYEKLHPKEMEEIKKSGSNELIDLFYRVVRHYMDYWVETNETKVEEEIFREIPLSLSEERFLIFPEEDSFYQEFEVVGFQVSVISAQGPREQMEDEYLATEFPWQDKKIPLFGVFDGHGGIACSHYVKQRLATYFEEGLKKINPDSNIEMYNALRSLFVRLDKDWKTYCFQATNNQDFSGTTATVCMIAPNKTFWIANVGDSRAVLAKGSIAVQLSEEAKATNKKYEEEIYQRGGETFLGRVKGIQGTLDMARSIGDIDQPSVSALPTIKKYELDPVSEEKQFLLLACDGLWDVVSTKMAVEVCNKSKTIAEAAHRLKQIAFLRGTTDNVTIVVVDLRSHLTHF